MLGRVTRKSLEETGVALGFWLLASQRDGGVVSAESSWGSMEGTAGIICLFPAASAQPSRGTREPLTWDVCQGVRAVGDS